MNQLDQQLYELFADKTLSEGCMIEYEGFTGKINKHGYVEDFWCYISENDLKHDISLNTCSTYNLLWHEPQLHDVFRYCYDVSIGIRVTFDDLEKYDIKWWHSICRYNPTLPLLQQEDSTKEQLIKLFS